MSLDYSLEKCSDEANTNGKVAAKFGDHALYSLTMAMMACGVPALKTDKDCEMLFDRAYALSWFTDSNRRDWWKMIVTLRGITTNVSKKTDAQFAKQLVDKMNRIGEAVRRQMTREMKVESEVK